MRLRPGTLLKKETLAKVSSCEFCEISKNTFFTEHLRVNTSVSWCSRVFGRYYNFVITLPIRLKTCLSVFLFL